MNRTTELRRAYFESLYNAANDPYGVQDRWYEQRKIAVLLASLPRKWFASGYEPGCGSGVLTAELANRCERLLAGDWSQGAVATARQRTSHSKNVTIEQHALPLDWPGKRGPFDLIVLSELGYFLDRQGMNEIAQHCARSLSSTGVLVACDWKPDFAERALATKDVHTALAGIGLPQLVAHEEDDFILRVWARDHRSVAEQEGIR